MPTLDTWLAPPDRVHEGDEGDGVWWSARPVGTRDRAGDHGEQMESRRVVGHLAEAFNGARVVRQLAVPLDGVHQDHVVCQIRAAAQRQERRPGEPEKRRQRHAANERGGEVA